MRNNNNGNSTVQNIRYKTLHSPMSFSWIARLPCLLGVKYFGGEPSRELVLDRDDLKLDRLVATGNDDDDLGVAAIGILSFFISCSGGGGGG